MNRLSIKEQSKTTKRTKKIDLREAEKILKNIKEYEARIHDIELEIMDLRDLQSICLKGISYDNLIKTNSLFSKTELYAMKDLEIEQTINLLEYKKRHIKRFIDRIKNAIESLDDIERQIIELKCIENKIWRFVVFEVNLEERQCRAIKTRALKRILKVMLSGEIVILD